MEPSHRFQIKKKRFKMTFGHGPNTMAWAWPNTSAISRPIFFVTFRTIFSPNVVWYKGQGVTIFAKGEVTLVQGNVLVNYIEVHSLTGLNCKGLQLLLLFIKTFFIRQIRSVVMRQQHRFLKCNYEQFLFRTGGTRNSTNTPRAQQQTMWFVITVYKINIQRNWIMLN